MSIILAGNTTVNRGAVNFNFNNFSSSAVLTTNWIWAENFVPTTTGFTDSVSQYLNLGVTFYSTSNGYIKSIRYYKDPNNTTGITGSLWSGSTELARVNFSSTPSAVNGWVSQSFSSPITITANTVYVASVIIAPVGGIDLRYYASNNVFDTASVINNSLVAVRDNTGFGRNGLYDYSVLSTPILPTSTNNQGPSYWVDIQYSNLL